MAWWKYLTNCFLSVGQLSRWVTTIEIVLLDEK